MARDTHIKRPKRPQASERPAMTQAERIVLMARHALAEVAARVDADKPAAVGKGRKPKRD